MKKFIPVWWEAAKKKLSLDRKMLSIMKKHESNLLIGGDPFISLIKAITGQQISLEAAKSVFNLLHKHHPRLAPKSFEKLSIEDLRGFGYSRRKASCMKDLAKLFQQKKWTSKKLLTMEYDTIYQQLIPIKGIGEWTIHMFAIFHQGESDIFPTKDIGIIKAIEKIYFSGANKSIDEVIQCSKKWAPYRSAACWYLWRTLDAEPVLY